MRQLAEGILYTDPKEDTDRPVLAILRGSKRSLMVDGGNSPYHARTFLAELHQHGVPRPNFIAITHAHCDHVFGLASLDGLVVANRITHAKIMALNSRRWDDASVAARVSNGQEHEMTAHMLKLEMPGDRAEFKVRTPELVYENKLIIDLGEITCHLEWLGGDHAADSAVIYVPERSVAFIGDCLYLRHTDRSTVQELFESLLRFPADVYVDSHAASPILRNELQERYRRLVSA